MIPCHLQTICSMLKLCLLSSLWPRRLGSAVSVHDPISTKTNYYACLPCSRMQNVPIYDTARSGKPGIITPSSTSIRLVRVVPRTWPVSRTLRPYARSAHNPGLHAPPASSPPLLPPSLSPPTPLSPLNSTFPPTPPATPQSPQH